MPSLRSQLLWILGLVTVVAAYATVPVSACPLSCGPDPLLIGYTRLPNVSREDAEKMLAWGRSFPCGFCKKRRYVTLLRYTQEIYDEFR